MPLYEFHCKKCGKDSEILTRSSDWKGVPCPSCGSTQLVKKLSVFAAAAKDGEGLMTDLPCGGNPSACGCGHAGACGLN
jgi:putative FmdB family regulatory protein